MFTIIYDTIEKLQAEQTMLDNNEKLRILEKINSLTDINDISNFLFKEIDNVYPFSHKFLRIKELDKLKFLKVSLPENLRELESSVAKFSEKLITENSLVYETCFIKKITFISDHTLIDPIYHKRTMYNFNSQFFFPLFIDEKETIGFLHLCTIERVVLNDEIKKIEEIIKLFYSSYYIYINSFIREDEKREIKFQKLADAITEMNQLITSDVVFKKILKQILSVHNFDVSYFLIEKDGLLKIVEGEVADKKYDYILLDFKKHFNKDENSPSFVNGVPDMACSYVFKTNNPIYFDDIQRIKDLPMSYKDKTAINLANRPIRSIAHIPIRNNDKTIGVLELFSFDDNIVKIEPEDLDILIGLCSFIPIAIKNSEIYTQLHNKNKLIEMQNAKILSELKFAQKIQNNLIPNKTPVNENFDLHYAYFPVEDVGGDFFDFINVREPNLLGIFISDVSGHGMPAALITSMVKTLIQTAGENRIKPDKLLKFINKQIYGLTSGNFITALYSIFDSKSKKIIFSRAAHNFPYLIRDQEFIEIKLGKGRMLGVFEETDFDTTELQLIKGDRVIFYTDGLTETHNCKLNKDFEVYLPELLIKNRNIPMKDYIKKIYSELVNFNNSESFEDDICIIGMEIK